MVISVSVIAADGNISPHYQQMRFADLTLEKELTELENHQPTFDNHSKRLAIIAPATKQR